MHVDSKYLRWLGAVVAVATQVGFERLARADAYNPNSLPIGERAAMLGNTGITSPYGEAVYYNPANLGRIDYPSLSVSGSTYLLYEFSVDPYAYRDSVGRRFSANGF